MTAKAPLVDNLSGDILVRDGSLWQLVKKQDIFFGWVKVKPIGCQVYHCAVVSVGDTPARYLSEVTVCQTLVNKYRVQFVRNLSHRTGLAAACATFEVTGDVLTAVCRPLVKA